jgi:ribonuclease P protein component
MRRSTDFTSVVRSGHRARADRLVLHQLPGLTPAAPLVGLVVGRSVGGSVVRHRVSRRLRAQLAGRLDRLPAGSGTVVRALPPSAEASSAELGADLDRALARVSSR